MPAPNKLGRTASHRKAMLRNMVTSLIKHERIKTTVPKAKELQRFAAKMMRYAKYEDRQHGWRLAFRYVRDKEAMTKLFDELAPRYATRIGGYTRVLHIGSRYGDAADMAAIEFVDREGELRPPRHPINTNPGLLAAVAPAAPTPEVRRKM